VDGFAAGLVGAVGGVHATADASSKNTLTAGVAVDGSLPSRKTVTYEPIPVTLRFFWTQDESPVTVVDHTVLAPGAVAPVGSTPSLASTWVAPFSLVKSQAETIYCVPAALLNL
jgi:hypothetical protein